MSTVLIGIIIAEALLMPLPFYRWWNQSSERSDNLPKIWQLIGSTCQVSLTQNQILYIGARWAFWSVPSELFLPGEVFEFIDVRLFLTID